METRATRIFYTALFLSITWFLYVAPGNSKEFKITTYLNLGQGMSFIAYFLN